MAGWSESKITSVDYKIPASDVDTKNLYLITGPANWMKSPHLISMVTLIIRVSMRTSKPIQFKTMKDLQNVWKSFAAMEIQDSELIKSSYKFFPLLMKYNKKIFKETASEAYPADAVSFHSPGGIVSLCNNNGPLAAVSDRVAELKRQYAK